MSQTPTFAVLPPVKSKSKAKAKSSSSSSSPSSSSSSSSSSMIGNWFDGVSQLSSNVFTRKYTLPDRTTASQVLMFRQLLHTSCKPGLRLSRKFQGTTAQRTVMHMPWWEKGVEETGRMVISYDNLITRLWMSGAILPYQPGGVATDTYGMCDTDTAVNSSKSINTLCDAKGLPPIPHAWWVERLGFQQEDPVTDFRSGGVLSLAMLLHIVESCPAVHRRFLDEGDVRVLPYAITSINVTDMLAKLCMFSKNVDKIHALMSSKPFWRLFADPNALLALQELSMDLLCDVVCELRREYAPSNKDVTVFDFHVVMERTEKRVEHDLLGAGPRTVDELRAIAARVRDKQWREMERNEQTHRHNNRHRNLTLPKMTTGLGLFQSSSSSSSSQRPSSSSHPPNQGIPYDTHVLARPKDLLD